ncbi:MAG TPA: hypothetical protein VF665_03315 [Longimicrobium sp.]|jgi:hypothetical protein|uniref:hypothetical protein n=1 Tax=Longimicrobium sp. TaxID=2029185 RepID=UPI002ED78A06
MTLIRHLVPLAVLGTLGGCGFSVTPPPQMLPPAQVLAAGQEIRGALERTDPQADDGSYYDEYELRGAPGTRMTVTLRSSEFDTFLAVGSAPGAGWRQTAGDDDGAGGTDSRLVLTLPAGGALVIRANSLEARRTGAYTLSAQAAP